MKTKLLAVSCVMVAGMLAGCEQYYQVTDPESGKVYYTRWLDRKAGGAYCFTDERTSAEVTLQNTEVLKLSPEAYRDGKSAPVKK